MSEAISGVYLSAAASFAYDAPRYDIAFVSEFTRLSVSAFAVSSRGLRDVCFAADTGH
jgi:hypothetical protein